ncbi:MAG TPA: c-type cytochrome [Methyloversatilis sp.]
MKKRLNVIALALATLAATHTASADPRLAAEKQCTACHAMDKDVSGPSFRAIAKKYSDRPEAFDMLVSRVKEGGWGHWGDMMMPQRSEPSRVSEEEASVLVRWILQLR